MRSDRGGKAISITVTRSAAGARTVKGSPGFDANALLAELNREFVLLDGRTFQEFIDVKALDRGRSFSGLLGLLLDIRHCDKNSKRLQTLVPLTLTLT